MTSVDESTAMTPQGLAAMEADPAPWTRTWEITQTGGNSELFPSSLVGYDKAGAEVKEVEERNPGCMSSSAGEV